MVKGDWMNFWGHFKTVHEHRKEVRKICFRLGLYYQGLTHDLSKYSPGEFLVGVKYYQGTQSPNNGERKKKGYSSAWLHHKGRNKHHFEYWIDYSTRVKGATPVRMPNRYLIEMYADRIAASKTYNRGNYTDDMPLKYYQRGKNYTQINERTRIDLEKLLSMLANKGEAATEDYIRKTFLRGYPGTCIANIIRR